MNVLSLSSFLGRGVCLCLCECMCVCVRIWRSVQGAALVGSSHHASGSLPCLLSRKTGNFIPSLQTGTPWHCIEPNPRELMVWSKVILMANLLSQAILPGMVVWLVWVWSPADNSLWGSPPYSVSIFFVVHPHPLFNHFQSPFLASLPPSPFPLSVSLKFLFRTLFIYLLFYLMIFIFSIIAGFQCSVNFPPYGKVTQSRIHIYILFLTLSSIMLYPKWLDIVPSAIQQDLIAYPFQRQ